MEIAYFFFIAIPAVLLAIAMIVSRNTVHSALFMVGVLFCVAMLFLSLAAEFLALIQVTVYAGAIMVLFLFVITMINPGNEEGPNRIVNRVPIAVGLALAFLVVISVVVMQPAPAVATLAQGASAAGNLETVGVDLFTQYLLPFELTSLLLIVAMVAALFLAKRRT
ncbi:MAG: NADH-quinone oxidoreductase subunit J [Chloroflexota bacterium]|jgi:NADH-quinone oxidoreductase subunit J